MKKKPTPKSLRAGQSLYFLGHPSGSRKRIWSVGRVVVGSDKLPVPYPGSCGEAYPRHYLVAHLQDFPGDLSYSRRNVERLAKEVNADDARRRARGYAIGDAQ